MTAVTRDSGSGKWFPASPAEWTSLVQGRSGLTGLAASLVEIWGMQDASGSLVGTLGAQTLAGSGASYQNTVAPYTRKAVQPPSGSGGGWSSTSGPMGDTGVTSQMFLIHCKPYASSGGADRDLIGMQFSTGYRGLQINTADKFKYAPNDGSSTAIGTASPVGVAQWMCLQTDRGNNFEGGRSEQETLTQSPNTNPSTISNGIIIGPALNTGAFSYMFYGAGFRGAGSQINATGWSQLVDCLNNGPGVASIAVTPTPVSLGTLGSTQQLAATCTRTDGTTYDGTSAATIASAGLSIGNVMWATSNAAVATVSSSGLVTATGPGTCNITASFQSLGASAVTSNASVVTVAGVVLASITVGVDASVLATGGTLQLTATAINSDGSTSDVTATATWSSSSTRKATVSSSGVVRSILSGSVTISATVSGITGTAVVYAVDSPGKYASMHLALLPPGRIWRYVESLLADLFAAFGDELCRLEARTFDLLDEDDPTTAIELLPEYENELDLDSSGTTAQQQANVVSRLVARQRYRPVDFQMALAPLLGIDAASVVVIERSHAFAASIGDDREIFRFFIYRDPSLPGTYFLASAQALVNKIKPSHTVGTVIESINFLCDDPHSLCDRDLLGA